MKIKKNVLNIDLNLRDDLKLTLKSCELLNQIEYICNKYEYCTIDYKGLVKIVNISIARFYQLIKILVSKNLLVKDENGIKITNHYRQLRRFYYLKSHRKIAKDITFSEYLETLDKDTPSYGDKKENKVKKVKNVFKRIFKFFGTGDDKFNYAKKDLAQNPFCESMIETSAAPQRFAFIDRELIKEALDQGMLSMVNLDSFNYLEHNLKDKLKQFIKSNLFNVPILMEKSIFESFKDDVFRFYEAGILERCLDYSLSMETNYLYPPQAIYDTLDKVSKAKFKHTDNHSVGLNAITHFYNKLKIFKDGK